MRFLSKVRDWFADRFDSVQYAAPRQQESQPPQIGLHVMRVLLGLTTLWIVIVGGVVMAGMGYLVYIFLWAVFTQ